MAGADKDKEISPLAAPDNIVFQDVGDVASATLNLGNDHPTRSLYFKVRLTMPKSYRVRPNEGEIKPGETFPIPVTVNSKAPPVNQRTKDRFQIISILADDKDAASAMWKQYSDEKKSGSKASLPFAVYDKRLKCVFNGSRQDIQSTVSASSTTTVPTRSDSVHRTEPVMARKAVPTTSSSYEDVSQAKSEHTSRTQPLHLQQGLKKDAMEPVKLAKQDDMMRMVIIFVVGLLLGKIFL